MHSVLKGLTRVVNLKVANLSINEFFSGETSPRLRPKFSLFLPHERSATISFLGMSLLHDLMLTDSCFGISVEERLAWE